MSSNSSAFGSSSLQEDDHLLDILGAELPKKLGLKDDRILSANVDCSQLNELPCIALFFSANWCPPCRGFIPILEKFQETVNSIDFSKDDLIGSDSFRFSHSQNFMDDQLLFEANSKELNSLLATYRELKKKISDRKLMIQAGHSTGEDLATSVLTLESSMQEISFKINMLVTTQKAFVARNLEVIYVSLDLAKEQYQEHLIELGNWLSIPYGDPRNEALKKKFGVVSIPQIVIVSTKTSGVIVENARQEIFLNTKLDFTPYREEFMLTSEEDVEDQEELQKQCIGQIFSKWMRRGTQLEGVGAEKKASGGDLF